MRQHLTEMDTIGTIRQSIRHPIGKNYIWVLVEGTTDLSLYRKLLDGENCQVEIIHGGGDSENSGSGIKKLRYTMSEFESCDRVIGIRDADFLHIEQKQETIRNLFLTDAHDAEMMLLACDAVFKNILIENLPNEFNDFILLRNKLLESLTFLGGIRWINHVENLTLKLKDIGLADFYDAINFCINKEKCKSSNINY
jgi:hypothetical protein